MSSSKAKVIYERTDPEPALYWLILVSIKHYQEEDQATTQNKNTAEYLIKEINIHHFVILKKFNFTDCFLLVTYILI